jgi:insecticidal toxin complex protein TccC
MDSQTPRLAIIDSRGLPVRQVVYWHDDVSQAEARITLQQHDSRGRLVAQRDPRLMSDAQAPANLTTVYSLTGQPLDTTSVDAGWRVSLLGEAGQTLHGWDSRGGERRVEYDGQVRALAVFERPLDGDALCTERYDYGDCDPAFVAGNQCGRLVRHDDQAGAQLFPAYGLTGGTLEQTRHFLQTLELPDWPESAAERDKWLEPGAGASTQTRCNPLDEIIEQTDARDNRQFFAFTVAGQLRDVRLQLAADTAAKPLVSVIQYNAQGQTVRETAGNGVITRLDYAAEDGRLTRLHSQRGSDVLQDLRYAYDPVGNVLSIEDAALPIRYFANQRIEPVNRYVYDSLDQLIKATGWEAGGILQGPAFSRFDDPLTFANYSQTYRYDRGGNLLELSHQGPQSHGHRLVAAPHGNRCLPVRNGIEPDEKDFEKGFDANGNLLNLQPGQTLHWDTRNQLCEVRPVKRDASVDDCERYVYAADGSRVRKVRQAQTNARTLISQTRYLPNVEIRTHSGTGEVVQVIIVQAGRNSVRVLHWESEPPKGVANDQHRYSLDDHLGSCSLELDSTGQVISQERYHPFGTTAWFAGRAEVEASYKTVRYSGKERDATGLYYYGFRYYVGWWQRWLNPDPAGDSDGLNLYDFCANNPIGRIDPDGRMWDDAMELNQALEQFLDNEPGLRADYGLPPFILRSDDANDDEPMDYQPSYNSPQGDESPSDSNPGTPGSPGSPAPPTSDQNAALVVLNKSEPPLGFGLNNRNLFEWSTYSGLVYRADRRKPDDVARNGFKPSDEFTAVPKMIPGPTLIVADGLKGAIEYAIQSGHTYYFYAIDATGVRGASLMENHVMNYPVMIKHLDAYPNVSPSNQTGGANSMFEAHLNHDDLVGRPIVSLGTLKDEVQRARR